MRVLVELGEEMRRAQRVVERKVSLSGIASLRPPESSIAGGRCEATESAPNEPVEKPTTARPLLDQCVAAPRVARQNSAGTTAPRLEQSPLARIPRRSADDMSERAWLLGVRAVRCSHGVQSVVGRLPALSSQSVERRHRAAAIRRRRTLVLRSAVVAGLIAAVVVAGVVLTRQTGGRAGRSGVPGLPRARTVLHPPAPIPGYLLIADRGNNRMLLVDGSRHIFWRYPQGRSQAMPFRFDDDTFFGPNHDRIISNQEDQDTIQIISFPAGRVLWTGM